ncbi:MAG: helix-turn-helix transcriptional regulator [Candidatus Dormibacteraeota bacterium]|uniref:Helix-turn-helix transcriptional regulator n=1 Tax=Candidatus Amunia macphersoniae TaxID=3127014 RepID=A0A934KKI8_9BACT|nr:helix-turn-helix transcriptional regulator [Candidatus Dormibacteraeota bacterium]
MAQPAVARRLLRARDYIDAHYALPLSVETIATVAHQSTAHFAREFRGAFGESPHQYLASRRLERAASLLANTDYTVARICASVGYDSLGSFTTNFRRVYRETPTQYRDRHLPLLEQRLIPPCVQMAVDRPQLSRIREDARSEPGLDSLPKSNS